MDVIKAGVRMDWRARARDPVLTVLAVLLAFASFVNAPLVVLGAFTSYVANIALWLAIVAAVLVLAPRSVGVVVCGLAAILGTLEVAERAAGLSDDVWYLRLTLVALFLSTLIVTVGGAVFGPGHVTYHRVLGAIVLYMAIAYWFVAPYQLIALSSADAFTGLPSESRGPVMIASLLYFSYVTLTSTGYGDIAPVHPLARGLANLEAVVGQLYLVTLLARMVTLHHEQRRH